MNTGTNNNKILLIPMAKREFYALAMSFCVCLFVCSLSPTRTDRALVSLAQQCNSAGGCWASETNNELSAGGPVSDFCFSDWFGCVAQR